MTINVQCSKTEEHMFHPHDIIVEATCQGKTSCGQYLHDPHTFDQKQRVWCGGICNCGDSMRGPHGPGDHK